MRVRIPGAQRAGAAAREAASGEGPGAQLEGAVSAECGVQAQRRGLQVP